MTDAMTPQVDPSLLWHSPQDSHSNIGDNLEEVAQELDNARKLFGTWLYLLNPPNAIIRAARRIGVPTLPDGRSKPKPPKDLSEQTQYATNLAIEGLLNHIGGLGIGK